MQNEVPRLPIVCSDGHKRSSRAINKEFRSDPLVEKINHTQCKGTQLQSNRKQLKQIGGPYKNNMKAHGVPESTRTTNKFSGIGQRIISAKMLRVKELQNKLTDAHYHLNELTNENRLLKAIQKRQDSALERYEGTNAELPRIINSHYEELKVISIKYKQLKAQHKYTCDLLKEKENEIHSLQAQNRRLIRLSKDQHLEEREKLKLQVSDLTHQIRQQHETIQILNRKLTLESKRLKHQINNETAKHRETKKKLQEALEKLKNTEELLASKEKQLYNGRLPIFNKRKKITSQSLTNLQDSSLTSSFTKPSSNSKSFHSELKKNSLPKLPGNDLDDSRMTIPKPKSLENAGRSETMTSLEQIRNFRLPKSAHSRRSSISGPSSHEQVQEIEVQLEYQSNFIFKNTRSSSRSLHNSSDDDHLQESEEDEEITNITKGLEKKTISNKYHLPDELIKEVGYLSSDDSEAGQKENKITSSTSKSRNLHAKLINGYIDSPNESEENFNSRLKEPIKIQEVKSHQNILNHNKSLGSIKDDSIVDNDNNDKISDFESEEIEEEIQINHKNDTNDNDIQNSMNTNDTKHHIEECSPINPTSWMALQPKNDQETNLNDLLLDFKEIIVERKSSNGDLSKKMDNDDQLLQYFDKNKRFDVEDGPLVRKELESSDLEISQQFDTSKLVYNGVLNSEVNNLDDKMDKLNEHKEVKVNQDIKLKKSGRREKTNISPKQESTNGLLEKSSDKKLTNFNKQKLLAAIKAIDDNENIEYIPKKKNLDASARSQVTENLYRGLPTHTKKRDDIIKDIFGPTKVDTKLQSGCSKLH